MNEMVLPRLLADRLAGPADAFRQESAGSVRLGMPQLSGVGLSETWLLKELADRHWMMLAHAVGLDAPDFRDELGHPVYAAFCAVRIEEARFELARENGRLGVASSICRVSRTQVLSRHALDLDGLRAGVVEMVSTFVKRTGASNHSIARVPVAGLVPIDVLAADLPTLAAAFRGGRVRSHLGFDLTAKREGEAAETFQPCPAQDFNGAGFLYFTSFLGFVDRTEWQLEQRRIEPLRRREVHYYGNVDAGEDLRVELLASRDGGLSRWWQIRRAGSSVPLADVFTQRARA